MSYQCKLTEYPKKMIQVTKERNVQVGLTIKIIINTQKIKGNKKSVYI